MVKNAKQAIAIQSRRIAAGKKGHARAVRRFMKRESLSANNVIDWYAYNDLRQSIPFIDPFPISEIPENE